MKKNTRPSWQTKYYIKKYNESGDSLQVFKNISNNGIHKEDEASESQAHTAQKSEKIMLNEELFQKLQNLQESGQAHSPKREKIILNEELFQKLQNLQESGLQKREPGKKRCYAKT